MATLKEIRSRIYAVKSIQKITKAMKMVAVAKLRKAQDKILSLRPYALKLDELFFHVINAVENASHPLMLEREVKNELMIVITSDRGLCGAFNTNILKFASNYFDSTTTNKTLLLIGKKGYDFFTKRQYPISKYYLNIYNDEIYKVVDEIIDFISNKFINNEFDRVTVIYNEFKSVLKQNVVQEIILPFKFQLSNDKSDYQYKEEYIYEPSAKDILYYIIPKQMHIQLLKTLFESNAAEEGARMTAMEMATNNANDLLRILNLMYNRARQDSITKELLEIVSGAEALQKG
ncbi:MAG: ATP synthase F1 subunit gamma [Ignavibacteria bacterium]|nr:ATP synthase F1 subunit gamma [Ignavibacteria bacterium]